LSINELRLNSCLEIINVCKMLEVKHKKTVLNVALYVQFVHERKRNIVFDLLIKKFS